MISMSLELIRSHPAPKKMEAVSKMSKKAGVAEAFCLMLIEISPLISKISEDFKDPISEIQQKSLNLAILQRIEEIFGGSSKDDLKAFVEFLETGEHSDVKSALKQQRALSDAILEEIEYLVGRKDRSTLDQVAPVVRKLAKEALKAASDVDLTPKDKILMFEKMSKLKAQLSGELVDKKEIEVTSSAAFKALIDRGSELDEKFSGVVIDAEVEVIE